MRFFRGIVLVFGLSVILRSEAASTSGIFGGGPFYSGGTAVMNDLRASGFTTVILWTIHVDSSTGDLILNDQKVASNGSYVGNAAWPGQLATLKQAPTSVRRIEIGIGSWGVNDFQSIKTLMAAQGTSTTSILYRNFHALKIATGADAINLDDEMLYDATSTVKFCLMCASMGYKVSLCPYTSSSFWSSCMSQINSQMPGTVDAVFLQCYAGGAGNDPATWNAYFGGFKVFPGLWCRNGNNCADGDGPSSVAQKMAAWKSSAGINGGFMWLYDDMRNCTSQGVTADYARAINATFRLSAPTNVTAIAGGGTVLLTWNPVSGASNYTIKRASSSAGPFNAIATNVTAAWFLNTNLTSTRWYYQVCAVDPNGEGAASTTVSVSPCGGFLPDGWSEQDIGVVGVPGDVAFCASTFTIQAGGTDIGNQADSFHFASASASNDCAIVARIPFIQGADSAAKAGVMLREDASPGSAFVDLVATPGQGLLLQSRAVADGASVSTSISGVKAPVWLQMVRSGDTFTGYYATDGVNWTRVGAVTVSMSSNLMSGLAASARSASNTVLAIIDNVTAGAPSILQGPTPSYLTRFAGAACTLSASATAALPVNYFWTQNGTNLLGFGKTTLGLTNLTLANSGDYALIASNAYGCATSSVATLNVLVVSNTLYPRTIVANHPVGYWRLSEFLGRVAYDYIGGNDGTYSNVLCGQSSYFPTDRAARFGYLLASNSLVKVQPIDFATAGSAAFSIEAWVNGNAQTNDSGIITKGTGAGGEQFNLDCGSTGHSFRFFVRDAAGNAHLANASVAANGKWHHVVGVCDQPNGKVYLYVDGTNAAQGTITAGAGLLASSNPMTIGARQSGAGSPYDLQFVGFIADVAVYNVALSQSQIQAHYTVITNRAPYFMSNPLLASDAAAGQPYTGSIAASAADTNGGTLVFAKLSGPSWLNISSAGILSGTPFSMDAGANEFGVTVTDPSGLSTTVALDLNVIGAVPITASVAAQGNNVVLTWRGGIAPYRLQVATNLANPDWQDVGVPQGDASIVVSPTNAAAFYRITGQ